MDLSGTCEEKIIVERVQFSFYLFICAVNFVFLLVRYLFFVKLEHGDIPANWEMIFNTFENRASNARAIWWRVLKRSVTKVDTVAASLTREGRATMMCSHHECLSVGFVEATIHRNVENTRSQHARIECKSNLRKEGDGDVVAIKLNERASCDDGNYHVAIDPFCAKVCFSASETLDLTRAVDCPRGCIVTNPFETTLHRLSGKKSLREKSKLHYTIYFKNWNFHIKFATAKCHISNKCVAALKLQHIIVVKWSKPTETPHANFALTAPSVCEINCFTACLSKFVGWNHLI